MKSNLLPIKLIFQNPNRQIAESSPDLFLGMATFDDLNVLGFGDIAISKAPSIKLTNGIKPRNEDEFEIELAVILPDLLPNFEDKTEYCVDLSGGKLWLSNNMALISYKDGDKDRIAIVPQDAFGSPNGKFDEVLKKEPKRFLKTYALWKGVIKGPDADSALDENISGCINSLMSLINEYVAQVLASESSGKENFGITRPMYDQLYFDVAYLLIKGEAGNGNFFRLALNLHKAKLAPGNIKKFETDIKWKDDVYRMFSMAKTHISDGFLTHGFLLLVITAELATSRFVTEQLKLVGVSQNKIDDLEKSLTFNVMFNSHVPALTKGREKLEERLVILINEARKKRNDFMHEGKLDVDKEYLFELRDSVLKYIEYLERVRS